ncbi:hypothetical protein niasHS_005698 [Heterodera schachtii]|uniref:Eukaryotic translation initiation factor 3 subunit C N-terminal domain-containing protein n=1 Tax=Heterodera schachtii TaxID=97005 RepID=A0ABD2JZ71_HETSC
MIESLIVKTDPKKWMKKQQNKRTWTSEGGGKSLTSATGVGRVVSASDLEPLEGKEMDELRRYFLKKDKTDRGKTKEKQEKAAQREKIALEKKKLEEADGEESWQKITYKHDVAKPLFDGQAEVTGDLVVKKLFELGASRRATNRKVYVRYLQELYKAADEHNFGVGLLAKVLTAIIAALFELNTRISDAMEFNSWMKTVETVDGLLSLLSEHPNVIISISTNEDEENILDQSKPFCFHGSVILMVKRLDDELTKIYQSTDCHSAEYIEKLRGESAICALIERAQNYVDTRRQSGAIDQAEILIIYGLRIEHLYYKYSSNEVEYEQLMGSLCKIV